MTEAQEGRGEDESELLGAWRWAFAELFGREVSVTTTDDGGSVLGFPDVFEPAELVGGSSHFEKRPEMAAHLRHLGFDWSGGRILTTPSPATFNHRIGYDGGFRTAYHIEAREMMSLGPWLALYVDGQIPVHVAPRAWYAQLLDRGDSESRALLQTHLTSLAHDLTVHALNYHLIPRQHVADLGDRLRAAVSERVPGWTRADAPIPLTLTYFVDNDLNRYCYEVWFRCERPGDFADLFGAHYAELLAALDVRLRETREGKGDVPDGDTDHMPPLEPTAFRLP